MADSSKRGDEVMAPEATQIISRLKPLADVLKIIDARVKSVTPRTLNADAAADRVLANDVAAPQRPSAATAMLDGWAVNAEETIGAGSYTPAPLLRVPPRVEVGQTMPSGTDGIAPFDAIKVSEGLAEALVTIYPGEGVLPAGGDSDPSAPLLRAGARLRRTDCAVLAAIGIARVTVREPRIRVMPLRGNGIIGAAARLIATDIERHGGAARLENGVNALQVALADDNTDAIIAIGGTGSGRTDTSVQILAREAELAVHGMAIAPGETAALGFAGSRPVLLLPGRLDAVLSVWLTLGRTIMERLAGASSKDEFPSATLTLARKVTSTIGLAELVPVKRNATMAEPMAAKYLSFSTLTQSDGWFLVPPESEGFAAGTNVQIRPWP